MAELNRRQQDILMQIHAEGEWASMRWRPVWRHDAADQARPCGALRPGHGDAHPWRGAPSGIGGKHRI